MADRVELEGTLRTTDPETRQMAKAYIRQVTEDICRAYGGQGEAIFTPGYDALINTNEIVDIAIETISESLGKEHIHFKQFPSLGVEDFSFFLNQSAWRFLSFRLRQQRKGNRCASSQQPV